MVFFLFSFESWELCGCSFCLSFVFGSLTVFGLLFEFVVLYLKTVSWSSSLCPFGLNWFVLVHTGSSICFGFVSFGLFWSTWFSFVWFHGIYFGSLWSIMLWCFFWIVWWVKIMITICSWKVFIEDIFKLLIASFSIGSYVQFQFCLVWFHSFQLLLIPRLLLSARYDISWFDLFHGYL